MGAIVLFDGECNVCDRSVQFIIKRDPKRYFKFASLQSEIGKNYLERFSLSTQVDSFILIENQTYYLESTAALQVCRHLRGFWKILFSLIVIPASIRNRFYKVFAKNRYKWFGKKQLCMIPSKADRERFLDY